MTFYEFDKTYVKARVPKFRAPRRGPTISVRTKGLDDDNTFDFKEIKDALIRLRSSADISIVNMSTLLTADITSVQRAIRLLKDTEAYPNLQRLIIDYFGDLQHPIPQTIGGYFTGCLRTSGKSNASCLPTCVGNLVIDRGENETCNEVVVSAVPNNGKYAFTIYNNPLTFDRARIYLTGAEPFRGFSPEEEELLGKTGIKEVSIMQCQEGFTNCTNITPVKINGVSGTDNSGATSDEFQPLYRISPRTGPLDVENSGIRWNEILILTGVILFVIFVFWWMNRKR